VLHELNVARRQCYRPGMLAFGHAQISAGPGLDRSPAGPDLSEASSLPPWLGPTRDWRWLLLYLGVPAVIGLQAGLNNWQVLQLAGYEQTLVFYAGHSFVPWWISGIATYGMFRVLRPWQLPPVVLLMLGGLLACALAVPYANWITATLAVGWLPGDTDGSVSARHIMSEVGLWPLVLRAVVTWTLANLLFDRWLGLPRYRYVAPAGAAPVAPPTPAGPAAGNAAEPAMADLRPLPQRLLQRLPADVAADAVIAVKAEQHYVKVYTADRSFMTLYRFSDAVAEMDPLAGSQVHRSWWVRMDAVRRVRRDGRKYSLELANNLVVPISSANRGVVQALARRANIPMPPA
jgi:hypothetical protein